MPKSYRANLTVMQCKAPTNVAEEKVFDIYIKKYNI